MEDPYEKTAAVMKHQAQGPKRLAKSAFGIGAAAAGASFAPILARAAPFLSEFIPQNLAIKGLTKINPRLGKFVGDAMNAGFDFNEAKKFLGEQITESQEPAKQDKNIVEQVSPELHQFVDQLIKGGKNAYQAGAIASKDKRFADTIQKLEKQHKVSWADILDQIYGQSWPKNKKGTMQQEAERFDQQYGQQQEPPQMPQQAQGQQQQAQQPGQQQQQGGQGNQALMGILDKINQKLGG